TDGRGVFGLAFIGQLLVIDARHLNMDVNTVQQRPADTFLVAHNRGSRTGAFAYRVAVIAARAPVQLAVEIGPDCKQTEAEEGFSGKRLPETLPPAQQLETVKLRQEREKVYMSIGR
ncbi:MAG TPA: hypothetical protein VFV38_44120, partial [Ktedonobacteraceae bacterium]|nr:hypothetical protein [Ktedonobacteraceae bacterium]